MRNDPGSVRESLVAVGVEERVVGDPVGNEAQLPRQVRRVTDAGAQPLAEERRHLVGGVTGEEDPARTHRVGDGRMEAVHDGADEIGVVGRQPPLQQLPHAGRLDHLLSCFAGLELELPPPVVAVADDVGGRAVRVADLLDDVGERGHRSAQPDVEYQPVLVEALIDEGDPEVLADRARRTVGGNQPAPTRGPRRGVHGHAGSVLVDRVDSDAEHQLDPVANGGRPQERLQLGLVVHDRSGAARAATARREGARLR